MAQKYITLSEEALAKMCGLIRDSHSIAEAIDDENIATNSTYSSLKIQELLSNADSSNEVELTWAEYQALSEEEKGNGTEYWITDVDNDGTIKGYNGGTGIAVDDDTKTISAKDIKKNFIDNSNFRINTRGQSEYTASGATTYTVDRWYIDGGTLTPVESGIQFVNPNTEAGSSSLVRLKQNIPYTFADFSGKTITLSAKINDTIYTGTVTLPSEKPTEGTATQYIAVGIADFGINLNYSITGDYFVPYVALAYSRTITIEWMKLEVNDELTTYVEPDYATEMIKTSLMNDNGKVTMPYTKAEVDSKIPTVMTGATSSVDGTSGLVPAPTKGSSNINKVLRADGTWIMPAMYKKDGTTTIAFGSSIEVNNIDPLELWVFKDNAPNYKRVFLFTSTASGIKWKEIANLSNENDYGGYINIEVTESTQNPYTVVLKNSNGDTSTKANISLTRYKIDL